MAWGRGGGGTWTHPRRWGNNNYNNNHNKQHNNHQNKYWEINNQNNTQYKYSSLPSHTQWACSHCGLLHDNMLRRDCRLQSCPGINPNITHPGPKPMPPARMHPAWASVAHGTHSSSLYASSSHVALPSYTQGSLIPQSLTNNITKLGVAGP
eukprot:1871628-Karenia_brevis.AAC.1